LNFKSLLRALSSLLSSFLSKGSETTVPQLRQGVLGISLQPGKRTARAAAHGRDEDERSSKLGSIRDSKRRHSGVDPVLPSERSWRKVLLNLQHLLRSLASQLSHFLSSRSEKSTVPELRQGVLGIRSQGGERTREKDRRKNPLGSGSAAANFTILADPAPRHRAFATSLVIQCIGVVFLMALPLLLPEKLAPFRHYEVVALVAPPTTLPLTPPKIQAKAHPEMERLERPKVAKLMAPPKPVFEAPKFDAAKPARPRPTVHTGGLSAVSFAPPTVHKNAQHVQTGGFGDPYGLPGPGDPKKRANIAQRGSFGLPEGAGFGNGLGGAKGVPGTVAGGGGAAQAVEPVEILSKPQPVYTQEARRLRLEGEVLVQVIFRASGEIRVIRVVRGLGHGLDESAVRAAQQIRFKPARHHGKPVDFPAVIHIVFQMAY